MRLFPLLAAPVLAFAVSACASARGPWIVETPAAAFRDGYDFGHRAGSDDARRGQPFRYADEVLYQRGGDGGWNRERAESFREGFATGYRDGYQAVLYMRPRGPGGGQPPGRGRGGWRDPAVDAGYADGYEAGRDDGEAGRAFEPVRERAYRDADRGYERSYGPLDTYKVNYRAGFRSGYEDGYGAARIWGR